MNYWLMKSEPSVYGIDHLQRDKRTSWGGVRNYQVRNMFRDDFAQGDLAFFYHSSCDEPGIVGTMKIAGKAYPDPTQFDPESEYFDPRSKRDSPSWLAVDVRFERRFRQPLPLDVLRSHPGLEGLLILRRGNRLSVTPVTGAEAELILSLAAEKGVP
ncbi:MAG: EVE domain-containing protein [Chromatiales bacterium]|nr:EVE domain-containing protein [Chromatiales bacterium]